MHGNFLLQNPKDNIATKGRGEKNGSIWLESTSGGGFQPPKPSALVETDAQNRTSETFDSGASIATKAPKPAARSKVMAHGMHRSIAAAVLTVASLALAATPSSAEPPARFENAILYSYLKADPPAERAERSFHGHKSSYIYFVNRRLGLGGDLVQAQNRNAGLMFGPELALVDRGRFGLRLHARVGTVRRLYTADVARAVTVHDWHLASAIGPAVDVYLGKGFALRTQPEIVWWRRGETHKEFRVSTGVVLRFGKIR